MGQKAQQSQEQRAYASFCADFKLKPEWFGKTFEHRGKTYTITGLNIRSKRFPVMTEGGTRFNADYLRALMTGDMASIEKELLQKRQAEYQKAREDYLSMGFAYGLDKSWLDKTFVRDGQTWRIDGLRPSARKYTVQCRRSPSNDVSFFQAEYIIKMMPPHLMKAA